METTTERDRTAYFDILRVIAMLAVIIIHVTAQGWYSINVRTLSWSVLNFYDSLARFGPAVFIMVSGALLLDENKTVTTQKLHRKNIRKMIVIYFVWSAFYILGTPWIHPRELTLVDLLVYLLSGKYHMWFLPMIVGLYLITPLLRKITVDRDALKYFLALAFLFTILFPFILLIMQEVGIDGTAYDAASGLYSNVCFSLAAGYSFYFVLGYYMNKLSFNRCAECIIYILGILAFLSTFVLSQMASSRADTPLQTYYGYTALNVFFETLSVFTFAKCRLSKWIQSERMNAVIRKLSKYSFGVYLIHPFFIDQLAEHGLYTLRFNTALSVPVITALVFVLSLIFSAILNHIPIVKKYLV